MHLSYAEILQYSGPSKFSEARWWAVGRAKAEGEDLNYFGIEGLRIAGGQGIIIIAVCQVSLCVPESSRSCLQLRTFQAMPVGSHQCDGK